METYNLVSTSEVRIDKFISDEIENISRSYAQKLIEEEFVLVDGKKVKSKYKLKEGQSIVINVPTPQKLDVIAEDIKLDIVYEDAHLIVVSKPQGMVVHPAAGNYTGTLVNALIQH